MIFAIIVVIIFVVVIALVVTSGNNFRDSSRKITNGMTESDVINIMGSPSYTKNHQDGSYEFVYEKSEWKGFLRGGTKVRRMEIVFDSNHKVISIGKNANCDRSGW